MTSVSLPRSKERASFTRSGSLCIIPDTVPNITGQIQLQAIMATFDASPIPRNKITI
ncbi:hypothetical protein D3C85_1784030 [compost metagenome]